MESICSDLRLKLEAHGQQQDDKRIQLNKLIIEKDLHIRVLTDDYTSLSNKISELERINGDLQEELVNLSKVSLLKKMHSKFDKLTHSNTVLKKRLKFYKLKCEKSHLAIAGEIKHTPAAEFRKKPTVAESVELEAPLVKNNFGIDDGKCLLATPPHSNDGDVDSDSDGENEIVVELIKIKRRYYYSEDSDGTNNIYKAIKIKKGDYDVGDLVGTLVDGKLIKNRLHM